MNAKKCLRYAGFIKYDNPSGGIIAMLLCVFEFVMLWYGWLTAMWFVIMGNDTILEKSKTLQTAQGLGLTLVMQLVFIWKPSTFFDLVKVIQSKIHEREQILKTTVYTDTNDEIEKLTQKVLSIAKIVFPLIIFPIMAQSYLDYYVNGLGADAFKFSYLASYPYNWKTPIAYFFTAMTLLTTLACSALLYGNCMLLFFGMCKFLAAFCADFKQHTFEVDDDFMKSIQFGPELPNDARCRLKVRLNQIVQYHCDINRLADRVSIAFNSIVATFIVIGSIYWCGNLCEFHFVSMHTFVFVLFFS